MEIKMSEDVGPTEIVEQEASGTAWREIGFAPALAGWYAVFVVDMYGYCPAELAEAPQEYRMPIAGWLTLEDEHTRSRRYVAAIPTPQGTLVPVDSFGSTHRVAALAQRQRFRAGINGGTVRPRSGLSSAQEMEPNGGMHERKKGTAPAR